MPERLRAATTFRGRLLAGSTLALGLGLAALLIAGNLVLGARVSADQQRILRARAQTALAAVDIRDGHVVVRDSPGSGLADGEAWVLDGPRLVSRPRTRTRRSTGPRSPSAERADRRPPRPATTSACGPSPSSIAGGGSAPSWCRCRPSRSSACAARSCSARSCFAGLLLVAGWYAILHRRRRRVAAGRGDDPRRRGVERERSRPPLRARPAARRADRARGDARRPAGPDRRLAPPRAALRRRGRRTSCAPRSRACARAPSSSLRAGRGADAERVRALDLVVTDVDRLTAAIDALLAVARGEAGAATGRSTSRRSPASSPMSPSSRPTGFRPPRVTPSSCGGRSRRSSRTLAGTPGRESSSC